MPEHRAALERLVRAQTGLDVRFNELGLRWGWYGPEAVFRRVELGEPGRSNVLLRAPQLVVGFDAWRTMQTGQLAAGRITLIAPDIDLERFTQTESPATVPGPRARIPSRAAADTALASRARILERWRGGRIELQGGTLKLPDPNGSANPITVQVRRASLRRTDEEWNGYGLVYLPERLGRAARIVVQLRGDISQPRTLTGGVRFEGMRLAFAGWRDVLSSKPALARSLPATGTGDLTVQLSLQAGRIEKASGEVKANDITLGTPPWLDPEHAATTAHGVLSLEYLAGDWRFVSRAGGSQIQLEKLVLSREDKDAPLPNLAIELSPGHIHGSIAHAPLRSAAAIARWLAPQLLPAGVSLKGKAEDIDFDWNDARVAGERLAASALVDEVRVASRSGSFALSGLRTRVTGSESRIVIELDAPAARLDLASLPEQPLEAMKLAAVVQVTRSADGWQMSTDNLSVEHDSGHLMLSGVLSGTAGSGVPVLAARGTIPHANIAKLRTLFAEGAQRAFGTAAERLTAGRIEDARFELNGPLDELFPERTLAGGPATLGAPAPANDAFKGSLTLRDARIAGEDAWPHIHALHATLEWTGPRVRASVDEGQAGVFEIEGVEAQWDVSGARASHVGGRAHARLEQALAWLRAHPEMQEQTPHIQDLVVRGDALFDFDITVPPLSKPAPRGTPPKTRTRLAAVLEGVQLRLASDLPPVEALRGSLAFDSGRLQRSTLSATWLGSPLTLKVSERRGGVMGVQMQGYVDVRKLVALSQLKELPEVSGETSWSGEFLYTAPSGTKPVRWQGRADSNLIGIASDLPAPFAKLANATLPLHVEMSGTSEASEIRAQLAERLRAVFALTSPRGSEWEIERGGIRLGTGPATLPASGVAGGTALRFESQSLGVLTGTLVSGTSAIGLRDVKWSRETLDGEASIHCAAALDTCDVKFAVTTDSAARALADLGFRPDIAAAQGSLSGQLTWQPRAARPWLETATGNVSMRFEDGIARSPVVSTGHPFPLLTVPALLAGIAAPPAPEGLPAGELRFRRLDADFELRDGQAYTSDLHFDGDAEILMRGRTGLLTRDYDHEAWVLKGEERIPASLRRLAATPRVAAAWLALRELVRGDDANQSHVVLHLRGAWTDPVVAVE